MVPELKERIAQLWPSWTGFSGVTGERPSAINDAIFAHAAQCQER